MTVPQDADTEYVSKCVTTVNMYDVRADRFGPLVPGQAHFRSPIKTAITLPSRG